MKIRFLIEMKGVLPVMYYAGYDVIHSNFICREGGFEVSLIHQLTDDYRIAKQYPSRKLAEDVMKNLPFGTICEVQEHSFGED